MTGLMLLRDEQSQLERINEADAREFSRRRLGDKQVPVPQGPTEDR